MKKFRRVSLFFISLLVVVVLNVLPFSGNVHAASYPRVDSDHWVVDTTGEISREYVNQLHSQAKEVENMGYQMAGVIINSTDDLDDYTTEFGNRNGIGHASKDNGIVFVIALDMKNSQGISPLMRIAPGEGIESRLNSAKVGRIMDAQFVPLRAEGNWKLGVINTLVGIRGELNGDNAYEDPLAKWWRSLPLPLQIIIIIIVLAVLVICALNSDGSSGGGGTYTSTSGGGGGSFSGSGTTR